MGIKSLKTLIKKCPKAISQIPLDTFRGKRIAIDANNIMIIALTPAWRQIVMKTKYPHETPDIEAFNQLWITAIKRQIERLIMAGITPVYVFDGSAPPDKDLCRQERREGRKKTEAEFSKLMDQATGLERYQISQAMITQIKKQASKLWPFNVDILKSILRSIGVPVIQGDQNDLGCEAERICANLCLDGYCSATLSTDRDTLVHGCPILITKFLGQSLNPIDSNPGRSKTQEMIEVVDLKEILIGLELSFQEFKEVCIMSGCDYNKNIRGIGPVNSWKLIRAHHSIDNLPDKYDISCLRHHRCRKLFSRLASLKMIKSEGTQSDIDLTINSSCLYDIAPEVLSQYQTEGWIQTLITLYSLLPTLPAKDSVSIRPPDLIAPSEDGIMLIIESS